MENNYEKDISIDVDALEIEWIEQPMLYLKYSQLCNEVRSEMDKAHHDLKVAEAELGLAMRADPESYNLPKTTESTITEAVKSHIDIVAMAKDFYELQSEYNGYLSVVRALEMKKDALENLVRLSQSDYFALSSEPRNIEGIKRRLKEVAENRAKSNNEILKKLNDD